MRARTSPSFTTELKSTFISVMVPEIWEPTWTCRMGAMPPLALTLCTMFVRTDASVLNSTGAGFLKRSQPVTSTVTSSRTAGNKAVGNRIADTKPAKPARVQRTEERKNGFMGKTRAVELTELYQDSSTAKTHTTCRRLRKSPNKHRRAEWNSDSPVLRLDKKQNDPLRAT